MIRILTLLIISMILANGHALGCECPQSIGAPSGSSPLVVTGELDNLENLVACGYLMVRQGRDKVTASEFQVFRCGATNPLLTFSALQTCRIESFASKIKITEISRWPFGLNWSWVDVPIWEYTIYSDINRSLDKRMVLSPPTLSKQQIEGTLKDYALLKQSLPSNEGNSALAKKVENMIGRMLALALTGNAEGQRHLEIMGFELSLDGYLRELHSEAVNILSIYYREINNLPEPD